jgi:tripartite-type tricarboxylate transporter receptor subunit TctC
MFRVFLAIGWGVIVFCGSAAPARSADQFYAGKTVRIVIGTPMGGAYGLYSQLVARNIGRFVPGRPTVIVQSMPGAGGSLPCATPPT